MGERSGVLSIESKNIFSILKKWLYAEPDIVFRELISNASDAIEKLQEIVGAGEHPDPGRRGRIDVIVNADARTLTIADNGLGMTARELERYINQIAFSGASDFVEKYGDQDEGAMIGHFGVGFYSAFMLSDHVVIQTRSHEQDEAGVRWECTDSMAYTMTPSDRRTVGTSVILELGDDSPYLKDPDLALAAIGKYFAFLRTEIYYTFVARGAEEPIPTSADGQDPNALYDQHLVNTPDPVWRRPASQVSTREMNAFYRDYFDDVCDPLFWIKIESVDLGLRGIVFFRDTKNATETLDGRFDVFSRGVFVEKNVAALVPKFVNLQSGIIECDDLPLVVSRSTMRGSNERGGVDELVHECLAQEVTIRLNEMFTADRATYERYWPEIGPFVKYGVLTDKIFASVMLRKVLFGNLVGQFQTVGEYLEQAGAAHGSTVFYASDPIEQAVYLNVFRKSGIPALILDHIIDQPLMRSLELVTKGVHFQRLDADLATLLAGDPAAADHEQVAGLSAEFRRVLGDRLRSCTVTVARLSYPDISVLITLDEAARRVGDMKQLYGLAEGAVTTESGVPRTLLVNLNNPLIGRLSDCRDDTKRVLAIHQLMDLALLIQGDLGTDDIPGFIDRSEQTLGLYLRTTETAGRPLDPAASTTERTSNE